MENITPNVNSLIEPAEKGTSISTEEVNSAARAFLTEETQKSMDEKDDVDEESHVIQRGTRSQDKSKDLLAQLNELEESQAKKTVQEKIRDLAENAGSMRAQVYDEELEGLD